MAAAAAAADSLLFPKLEFLLQLPPVPPPLVSKERPGKEAEREKKVERNRVVQWPPPHSSAPPNENVKQQKPPTRGGEGVEYTHTQRYNINK